MLFQRTWFQLPRLAGQLITTSNSSSRKSHALFWPLKAPGTHVVNRQTHKQKHPNTWNKNSKKWGRGHTSVFLFLYDYYMYSCVACVCVCFRDDHLVLDEQQSVYGEDFDSLLVVVINCIWLFHLGVWTCEILEGEILTPQLNVSRSLCSLWLAGGKQ